jgi:hypothetical protein
LWEQLIEEALGKQRPRQGCHSALISSHVVYPQHRGAENS